MINANLSYDGLHLSAKGEREWAGNRYEYLNAWAFWLANKARFQQEEMKGILDLFAIAID